MLASIAPKICPQCGLSETFAIRETRVECRHCGYVIRDKGGNPLPPPQSSLPQTNSEPAFQSAAQYLPSYRIVHPGGVNRWADAAFTTGIDAVRRQDWEAAVSAFYRALDSERDFVDAHLWIARIASDPAVKRDHYENVLVIMPNHMDAVKELLILDGKLDATAARLNTYHEPQHIRVEGAVGTATKNLRCERCDSPGMTIDDATGFPVCGSCGFIDEAHRVQQRSGAASLMEKLLHRRSKPVQWVVGERLLSCNSCGAERTIPARKMSEHCPFCGSNHVVQKDVLDSFEQPDSLVPFRITRQQAIDLLKVRLGSWDQRVKRWFDNNTVERATIDGMFLPFWAFDAMMEIRRTTHQKENDYWKGRSSYTIGTVKSETIISQDMMQNILVCGVKSPSPILTRRLGKYDLSSPKPYEPKLLAKFPAEIYSIDFDKASLEARSIASQTMRERHQALESAMLSPGLEVQISASVQQMQFQLLLLPVWVAMLYEEDGDVRSALINGQTGTVALGKTHKRRK